MCHNLFKEELALSSRHPKTLLICGSRTPAGIMYSYRLSLVIPVLTRPCVWNATKLCWGTFRCHFITHVCRMYPCFSMGGGGEGWGLPCYLLPVTLDALTYIIKLFTHLKSFLTTAIHSFKFVKTSYNIICTILIKIYYNLANSMVNEYNLFNPLAAKLFNLNFHPLEVVSRWRDPQLQVSENYSDLTKGGHKISNLADQCHFLSLTGLKADM